MKVILAISGGVDSMVMLDIFGRHFVNEIVKQYEDLMIYGCARPKIIAATFNHGTRPSAKDDVLFVRQIIKQKYRGLPLFTAEANLGEHVSEAEARAARYNFLHALAEPIQKPNMLLTTRPDYDESQLESPAPESVLIYTAHHLDDLVESIAINLLRGTGWRGLAPLDTPGIKRPFLEPEYLPKYLRKWTPFDKTDLCRLASDFDVVFRQDPTNYEDNYLRNRVRAKLTCFERESHNTKYKLDLYNLWLKQKALKAEIDQIVQELLPAEHAPWQRSWFKNLDEKVALELLRAGTLRAGISATRPQLHDFLHAIRTYSPGKRFNLPGNNLIKFTKTEFLL